LPSVLIVEDSQVVLKVLRHVAAKALDFDVHFASSRAEAKTHLASDVTWLAAIIDLNLPDAPNGELVDDVLAEGIPTIVLTGSVNEEKRESLTKRGIVDYVLKEGRYSYQYAVNLVNRLYKNQNIKVLVAEDSVVTRKYIVELLSRHLFQVIEAENGQQAEQAILADPEIKLLLTDYNMPEKNGFELINSLRQKHEKEDLVIIGLSSAGDKHLSAKFIKNGANDFLYKPFSHEEFFCRILQDVESMERLEEMRHMAYSDALTGLSNRRAFIEKGRTLFSQAQQNNTPLALALLDIDHFKHINDDYGHDVGDDVLRHFSTAMEQAMDRFFVARTGGEEFCILFPGLSDEKAAQLLNVFRAQVENEFAVTDVGDVGYTFSGGVSQMPATSLDELLKWSDELLYRAKDAGRNMVMTQ